MISSKYSVKINMTFKSGKKRKEFKEYNINAI